MGRLLAMVLAAFCTVAAPALSQPQSGQTRQNAPGASATRYFCPMKCEGEKTYDAPGKCPVCGMKLKPVPAGYTLSFGPTGGEAKGGEPTTFAAKLADPSGAAVKDLDDLRGAKLHLYVVSRDLAFFRHVQAADPDRAAFEESFPPGAYVAFGNFRPTGGQDQVATASFSVSGKAANPKAMGIDADRAKEVDGCSATLRGADGLKAGREATLTYTLSAGTSPLPDLTAAKGQVIAISHDLKHLVLAKPVDAAAPRSELAYRAVFPEPGLYRIWLEVPRSGKAIVVPFVVEAK